VRKNTLSTPTFFQETKNAQIFSSFFIIISNKKIVNINTIIIITIIIIVDKTKNIKNYELTKKLLPSFFTCFH